MLHTIGKKQSSDGDLVDMLLECHGRIRNFSGLAIAVGERADVSPSEVAEVCARVERYFSQALPLHVRDEEESILPRLRGRSAAVDAALDRMHEQHALHEDILGRMLASCAALRANPEAPDARGALLAVARPLWSVFEPHLEAEEQIIFPAIRALLSPEERAAIVGELRERRR